jgi:hypothetical protein
VSPILTYTKDWHTAIDRTLNATEKVFSVETNESCATHVHIRPSTGWIIKDLKKLACCLLFFEGAMELLYPAEYKQNKYAAANGVDNPKFNCHDTNDNRGLRNCFQYIQATNSKIDLVDLMNPGRPDEPGAMPYDRYYGWNFTNLTENGIGTVEYRRPPGVTTSHFCKIWIALALTFVLAAQSIDHSDELFQLYPDRDIDGLKRFLRKVLRNGVTFEGHFGNLFDGLEGRMEVRRLERRLGRSG